VERTTVAVTQAQVTNAAPNLVAGRDAFFRYAKNTTGTRTNVREVEIPQGLYTLSSLALKIYNLLASDPATASDADLFTFSYEEPTNRTLVACKSGVSIFWDSPAGPYSGTVQDLFGFDTDTVSIAQAPILSGGFTFLRSQGPPRFNKINQYFIGCPDLVVAGIPNNNVYNNTIAMVPITEAPGNVINYVPGHPLELPCSWSANDKITSMSWALTDENGNPAPLGGEPWSITFEITFYQ